MDLIGSGNEIGDQAIEQILQMLLNPQCNIQEYDANGRCVLMLAYTLSDKRYFQTLVKEYKQKLDINNEIIQSLLHSIIASNNCDILSLVLDKCDLNNCNSEFLLNLATESLEKGNANLLTIIFKFISKTEKLENGETFLTNLFKRNIEEATIKQVIEMKLFNLNTPNNAEETALTLACDSLMVEIIKILLKNGSDASYRNHYALERTFFAKANQPMKEKEANEIKDLLISFKATPSTQPADSYYTDYYGQRVSGSSILANEYYTDVHGRQVTRSSIQSGQYYTNASGQQVSGSSILANTYYTDSRGRQVSGSSILANEYYADARGLKVAISSIQSGEYYTNTYGHQVSGSSILANEYYTDARGLQVTCSRIQAGLNYIDANGRQVSGSSILEDKVIETNEQKLVNIMTLLVANPGDIMKTNTKNQCALYLAYMMTDKRFYNMFIRECPTKIEILSNPLGLFILENLIDTKQMTIFYSTLNISVIEAENDPVLLALALRTLRNGTNDQYPLILKLCTRKNSLLKSNETFLTSLFKKRIPSKTIMDVILSNNFDVNTTNKLFESPLMLACEQLMPDVVSLLLQQGANLSFNNYKAIDVLVMNKSKLTDIEVRTEAKNQILDIISGKKDIPFETKMIPENVRIFELLDINSKVVYYKPENNSLTPLYGTVRWTGINARGDYMYGIELDDMEPEATDGEFKKMRLFHCSLHHGIVVPIQEVAPDHRLTVEEVDEKSVVESRASDTVRYCCPYEYREGSHFGIQGSTQNAILESIIFAIFPKSNVLDYFLSPKDAGEVSDVVKQFKDVLSWSVVYALREFGAVSFHKVKLLKTIFEKYNEDEVKVCEEEIGIRQFTSLLSKLRPAEPLLNFKDFQEILSSAMFLSIEFTSEIAKDCISSQELLEIYMAENSIMFSKTPVCLIIDIPKDVGKSINCQKIVPLKTINVSQISLNHFQKCLKCDKTANYQCKKCIKMVYSTEKGLFCNVHKCCHSDISKLPRSDIHSKSLSLMNLHAIMCLENDRYVVYVKESHFTNQWVRFDACARKHPTNNSYVPAVKDCQGVTTFLNMDELSMAQQVEASNGSDIESLLNHSRMLVYESAIVDCY